MVKDKTKFGFSLAEALVSMLVLSMFFMATSKIISTKPKSENITYIHGFFECYTDGGRVMQKLAQENAVTTPKAAPGGTCTFTPPKGIDFVIIYALNDSDGGVTKFYTSTDPILDGDSITGSDKVTITSAQLANFQDYLEESEGTEQGNDQINEFINFLAMSHPKSSLYGILKNDPTYKGPAVILGW